MHQGYAVPMEAEEVLGSPDLELQMIMGQQVGARNLADV